MDDLFHLLWKLRKRPAWFRIALMLVIVASAFGLRLAWLGEQEGYAYSVFHVAEVIIAASLGVIPGVLATLLSAALAVYYFVPPNGFIITNQHDLVALYLFLGAGLSSSFLFEALHQAIRRHGSEHEQLNARIRALEAADAAALEAAKRSNELLRETSHRFRNDLQRLSNTIMVQQSAATEEETLGALNTVLGRIQALNAVNTRLDASMMGDSMVHTAPFLGGLVEDLQQTVGMQPIAFRTNVEDHTLPPSRAMAIGLILNEWITNAIKYAFRAYQSGTITVSFSLNDGVFTLTTADDGVGYGGGHIKGTGLGGKITRSLASQIGGTIDTGSPDDGGFRCTLSFPEKEPCRIACAK